MSGGDARDLTRQCPGDGVGFLYAGDDCGQFCLVLGNDTDDDVVRAEYGLRRFDSTNVLQRRCDQSGSTYLCLYEDERLHHRRPFPNVPAVPEGSVAVVSHFGRLRTRQARLSVKRYRSGRSRSAREGSQVVTTEKRNNIDIGADRDESHSPTVAEVGEFGVIDRSTRGRIQSSHTILGPGDDAAVVSAADGRVVATTDMLVEGRHFRLDWSSPIDVGRKAVAQNGADIAAMGARCIGFLVALGCPASTSVEVTDGLSEGLWREAQRAGASIIGGDLVQSEELVISITALGDLEGRPPVLRSGACPGDVVAVFGHLGWSAAGLAVLEAGRSGHAALVDAHRVPAPEYEQGVSAALAGATSLTDVSDGLVADLGHIAHASSVSVDLNSDLLDTASEIVSAATDLGVSVLSWVLGGGEDHAFAATFPRTARIPDGWTVVGHVSDPSGSPTVTVDGEPFSGPAGWSSFDGSTE